MGIARGLRASSSASNSRIERSRRVENPSIPGTNFVFLEEVKKQAIGMIYGDTGTGKSTFVTDFCPQPIAFINYDGRAESAVHKARQKGRIIHFSYIPQVGDPLGLSSDDCKIAGQRVVDDTIKDLEGALRLAQQGDIRTICIDTCTEYGEAVALAIKGKLDPAKDFGKAKDIINRQLWRLSTLVRETPAHLILLARAKPEPWVGGEPTGKFIPRCPETLCDAVDWIAQVKVREVPKGKLITKKFEYKMVKAGVDIAELGVTYKEEDYKQIGGPFVYICMNQYPDCSPDDWK